MRQSIPALLAALSLAAGCGARTSFYEPVDPRDGGAATDRVSPADVPVSSDVPVFPDLPIFPDRPPACPDFLTLCNGRCVDTSSDPAACGGCGVACAGLCVGGVCRPVPCMGNTILCGERCVDLGSDSANCGRCGIACPRGAPCRFGRCASACEGIGRTDCGGRCVDLRTDRSHCGACGRACMFNTVCANGACVNGCAPPTPLACIDRCVDPQFDSANCGACGRVCLPGTFCQGGECAPVRPLTGPTFRIVTLGDVGCVSVEHNTVTGDDRGGIAVSSSRVFYTGDTSTGAFDLDSLTGAPVGEQHDALVGNLRDGQVYVLMGPSGELRGDGSNVSVTGLGVVDGVTGRITERVIPLSRPIALSRDRGSVGIFAGFDRVVIYTGARVFNIDLPSARVTDLGSIQRLMFSGCESWAFWGVAEFFEGTLSLAYVRDAQTIVRTRVPDGLTAPIATFRSLSDMCSFTVAPSRGRWYWHHEGQSQFRSGDETLGYCAARFM